MIEPTRARVLRRKGSWLVAGTETDGRFKEECRGWRAVPVVGFKVVGLLIVMLAASPLMLTIGLFSTVDRAISGRPKGPDA